MEIMDIVVCTDKWFVMPTGVMMQSVCVNNPEVDIVFHIIVDDTVSAGDRHDLEEVVSSFDGKTVMFYAANKEMLNRLFPAGQYRYDITKTTYYRLYIAELLPKNIEKVLYLDGDVIVRHSLLPLWKMNIEQYAIVGAYDGLSGHLEFYDRLKYPAHLGYVNAGVLLINLHYWREHDVLKLFVEYMNEHSEDIKLHDQDVLNVVFCDKKLFFPLKYNLQHPFLWENCNEYDYRKLEAEVLEARKDPVIVHYTSSFKPWKKYQRRPHPFRSTFNKYQNQTKWKGVKTDNRSLKMRLVNFIADTLRMLKLKSPWEYAYIDISPLD